MSGLLKLLFAAPLVVSAVPLGNGLMNAELPPERYRGDTAAVVIFTDRAGIDAACGVAKPPYTILACTKRIDGTPVIFMPNACSAGEVQSYAKIMCHEAAHVQGWSREHEL